MTVYSSQLVVEKIMKDLQPMVSEIDEKGLYPKFILERLADDHFYKIENYSPETKRLIMSSLESLATVCSTTAFVHWCHVVSLLYVQLGKSHYLKEFALPLLQNGDAFGATGLSNAMKYYAGMETLLLKATPVENGFVLNGFLPFVSNIDENHWFAFVAEETEKKRIMGFLPTKLEGLTMKEINNFIGLNGTATFSLKFENVFIATDFLLDENADEMIKTVRGDMVYFQVGLILGLISASIDSISSISNKQNGINQYVFLQSDDLKKELVELKERADQLSDLDMSQPIIWKQVIRLRKDSATLALKSTQAELLHHGAAAYKKGSSIQRRIREAQFFAIVTPAIKQLEKMLSS